MRMASAPGSMLDEEVYTYLSTTLHRLTPTGTGRVPRDGEDGHPEKATWKLSGTCCWL